MQNNSAKEIINHNSDAIYDLLKIIYPGFVLFGILLLFYYFSQINYLPKGLSIGDSLVFLLVALSFSIVYAILLMICYILSQALIFIIKMIRAVIVVIARVARQRGGKKTKYIKLFKFVRSHKVAFFATVMPIIYIASTSDVSKRWVDITVTTVLIGGLLYFRRFYIHDIIKPLKNERHRAALILVALIAYPFFLISKDELVVNAMNYAGIRNDSAIIKLDDLYHDFLMSIAKRETEFSVGNLTIKHKNISYCGGEMEFNIPENGLLNVEILFTGIGSNTVIKINDCILVVPDEKIMISYKAK